MRKIQSTDRQRSSFEREFKIKKIDAIANEFKGQEVEVLQYLCKKYKVATSKVAGLDEAILLKATAKKQVIEEKVDESDTTTNTEIDTF